MTSCFLLFKFALSFVSLLIRTGEGLFLRVLVVALEFESFLAKSSLLKDTTDRDVVLNGIN